MKSCCCPPLPPQTTRVFGGRLAARQSSLTRASVANIAPRSRCCNFTCNERRLDCCWIGELQDSLFSSRTRVLSRTLIDCNGGVWAIWLIGNGGLPLTRDKFGKGVKRLLESGLSNLGTNHLRIYYISASSPLQILYSCSGGRYVYMNN